MAGVEHAASPRSRRSPSTQHFYRRLRNHHLEQELLLLHREWHDEYARRNFERRRRRSAMRFMLTMFGFLLNSAVTPPVGRAVRTRERSGYNWWEGVVLETWDDREWLDNFRMTRDTFMYICTRLRSSLERFDTGTGNALTVELRVGITLWRLVTNCEYTSIGHLFGVASSTASDVFRDTCQAINREFVKEVIRFPTGNELERVVDSFEQRWGFPQAVGAIDTLHIPIESPENYPRDYWNRKRFHSVVLQAVADDQSCFIDTCVGWPGSVRDARVYRNSNLHIELSENKLLPDTDRRIGEMDVPLMLLGDSAYPLQTHLMKPYSETGSLTAAEAYFNSRLSRARTVVESAFGRLKGRWQCLMERSDCPLEQVPTLVTTCCVLHNLCERRGNPFDEEWLTGKEDFGVPNFNLNARGDGNAAEVRRTLVRYFQDNRL